MPSRLLSLMLHLKLLSSKGKLKASRIQSRETVTPSRLCPDVLRVETGWPGAGWANSGPLALLDPAVYPGSVGHLGRGEEEGTTASPGVRSHCGSRMF